MITLEEEIMKLDLIASDAFEGRGTNEFRQLAEWLRELEVYRKSYSCYNCYNANASFNEYPCNECRRGREATKNIKDYYEEASTDED